MYNMYELARAVLFGELQPTWTAAAAVTVFATLAYFSVEVFSNVQPSHAGIVVACARPGSTFAFCTQIVS